MNYLMALQVRYFPTEDDEILIESAFWNHILMLKNELSFHDINLSIAAIPVDAKEAKSYGKSWIKVSPKDAGVRVISLSGSALPNSMSKLKKILSTISIYKHISRLTRNYDVIHTGLSYDLYLPTSFFSAIAAVANKRYLIYVVDIDFRKSTKMRYINGEWSFRKYLTNRLIFDPIKLFQLNFSTKHAELSLLKGRKFASDYKQKGKNVHPFFDTAHNKKDIDLISTLTRPEKNSNQLSLVYFGRAVKYKGIQDAINAIQIIKETSTNHVTLSIIGDGPYLGTLKNIVHESHLEDLVRFFPSIPYGKALFSKLMEFDYLIALPHSQDTPRSAFDAMACGLPIVAYDTYYYKELGESGAVLLSPWRDTEELANLLIDLSKNKSNQKILSEKARKYALDNTQDSWLKRRVSLTIEALNKATTNKTT